MKKFELNENNKNQLIPIITELCKLVDPSESDVQKVFRKFPKNNSGMFKKSDILINLQLLIEQKEIKLTEEDIAKLRSILQMKKTRTISGVTPVTVLTKPFPCPGKCIFCPNDVRMPKSYLSDEPGAQRATRNKFDPYLQTYNRLMAYKNIGHPIDKIELIILGGTWTSYPEPYQIWYVKRCFDAMNDFAEPDNKMLEFEDLQQPFDDSKSEKIDGTRLDKSYNQVVTKSLDRSETRQKYEHADWQELFDSQKANEAAKSRCVGLVIETRPDEITKDEVIRIRKLGATKTQIGFQSLNDKVLSKNKRGHDVKTTRNAVNLLRQAGFKIHAHWMPNLYGSNPNADIKDFKKMFVEGDFKPDELKVYPCSLIASAELMQYYKKGLWQPYTNDELMYVLKKVYKLTPNYCRITRMIRDIGSQDIVTGNKVTNFRELVEKELEKDKSEILEIRHREIRGKKVRKNDLAIKVTEYKTSVSKEYFLEYVTKENEIAGFLRLSIPTTENYMEELKDAAIIREIHVYGQSVELGNQKEGKAQHLGLGKSLIDKAQEISKDEGFAKLAVISSIGTREYYEKLGFVQDTLYQIANI